MMSLKQTMTTKMTKKRLLPLFALLSLLATSGTAQAISVRDPDNPPVVIQNRHYQMAHELSLQLGLIPIDAYYKGVTGSLRYTWHISESQAWEVLSATYSYNWDSRLKDSLIREFGANPMTDYELREAVLLVDSNYVLKPFYGKMALFNHLIVRSELYLNVGPAYGMFSTSSTSFEPTLLSHRGGFNYGMGLRIFSAEWFSLRVDLRHYVLFAIDALALDPPRVEVDNILYLGLGGSFNIGYD